jgi:hypothetical protein
VQGTEIRAGLDAEFLDQPDAARGVASESLGVPAAGDKRLHQRPG